ncbi:MAG: carboxypeptidase regulatory-like domain-containing protein [bacterium]
MTDHIRHTTLALAFVALASTSLHAQTRIVGVVIDSVTNKPLAKASVQLVSSKDPAGSAKTVDTDSSGTFHVDNVAPGRYLMAFTHPRLDDLGIEAPARQIEVQAGTPSLRIDFGVPSARTLAKALCGAHYDSSGVLAGRIIDADGDRPLGQGNVTASWVELRLVETKVLRTPRVIRATSDESGRYAMCGIPTDIPVRVQATASGESSGEIELQPLAGSLLHRDLHVTHLQPRKASEIRQAGSSKLSGHVRRPNGLALVRAQVIVLGTGMSAVTNTDGYFELDSLPAGTRAVEARALGYVPLQSAVDLKSGSTTTADLTVGARVDVLEAITVFGKAPARGDAALFNVRAKGMYGRFFNAQKIKESGMLSLPDLLRMVPGIRVEQAAGSLLSTVLTRGLQNFDDPCLPAVYLDGMIIMDGASSLDNLIRPAEVGGVEVYVDPVTAPIQFQHGSCGAIVIWTKGMVP